MSEDRREEPIAIVGSACRFPGGAGSPAALAELLKQPRDVAVDIPPDRFNLTAYYHPDGSHHGSTNVRQSYLLDGQDLRRFDSMFFNISPNEADSMDPQQRLLLETVYEALESGGHRMEDIRGSDTAVYTGTMSADYVDTIMRDSTSVPTYAGTGTNRAIISNRISYVLDWHGPSMTIDTACSSSLIAIHLAVRTLRAGESRLALGCGTQVILNPEQYVLESKLNMLSPSGRSRMWDADADGYARGEGVAAVVLKRLADAIADGDHIQCIIRETGTNQDGHSTGITVPSADAQAALIRDTYKRAGLHPETNAADRPQFFEAHGTGTKAGDPKEAAAIHEVFGSKTNSNEDPLYVGSIKTVIGHLEGSAGIAGVLKACAMVQHGDIYPNLLLNRLNPDVAPFYKGVQVPKHCLPWPKLQDGVPRRVSINSFGFGGSNAHAIIEQFHDRQFDQEIGVLDNDVPQATPFTFSAQSETALLAQLEAYSNYLQGEVAPNLGDLAWTLQARRSELSHKAAFSASSLLQLKSKIDTRLREVASGKHPSVGTKTRAGQSVPKVMAIFTGQGAQWPSMGAQLLKNSEFVRQRVQELEESLATLHPDVRPAWSLVEQILAEGEASRVSSADISQPLCTAIQISLVDLLSVAGIQFHAVVGHSSGEIAAAYAAHFISAQDAIRIAYYRGRVLQAAGKGAMMAVAASWEEAIELTQLPALSGRVAIAAHNSSASVTLSGDVDGIAEAKEMLDEGKKFARLLKVDKAYHSHHMVPCGDAYVGALRLCVGAPTQRSDDSCAWFSSVKPNSSPVSYKQRLEAEYWRDNLTSPVLFAEAVQNAIAYDDEIGVVVEIGPHPALKGPTLQNITEVRPKTLPYSGTLIRGASDVESLSDTLGFLWTHLGSRGVNFKAFAELFSADNTRPRLVVGLPSYQWDHSREHWSESRRSRRLNSQKQASHEVLGVLAPESTAQDMRWNNVLKQSEIQWLDGHKIQGQIVFPAAGYVAMALEASKFLAPAKVPIRDFELSDLSIEKAIVFQDSQESSVETLVTLTQIKKHDDRAEAFFCCYAMRIERAGSDAELERIASCTVTVTLLTSPAERMSIAPENDYRMSDVDSERFYKGLAELGYHYSGHFRTISSMRRKYHTAKGLIKRLPANSETDLSYLVHPCMLDMAFQLAMLAFSAPGDGALWALHLPTWVQSIRVDAALCSMAPDQSPILLAEATTDRGSNSLSSHVDIMSEDRQSCWVRVENVIIKPFAPATELDDRVMFGSIYLGLAEPDGYSVAKDIKPSLADADAAIACERISYFYHRKWKSEISDVEWNSGPSFQLLLRDWIDDTTSRALAGNHPTLKQEWSTDSEDEIKALASRNWECVDIRLLTAVGENMVAAVRGETTILEHMTAGGMLDEYYLNALGLGAYWSMLAAVAKQITFRYPRTKFIEIGAGSGSETKRLVEAVHTTMSSYTYTENSRLSLEKTSDTFSKFGDKMIFKPLDIEKPPESQGYQSHAYDVAIGVNMLHATQSLEVTLTHIRQLLRPGGYLLLLVMTNSDTIRYATSMAGLPGWWRGGEHCRYLQPSLPADSWHSALIKSGFSGIDTQTPDIENTIWPFSVLVSQAVDERVQVLRQPLSASAWSALSSPSFRMQSLVILGTGSKETCRIAEELMGHLSNFCDDVTVLKGLPTDQDTFDLNPLSTFINLVDLECPIFKDMTSAKFQGLRNMYGFAKQILWVTQDALVREPYHMGSISFNRTVRREEEHISVSHLDLSDKRDPNVSKYIAEHLLRAWVLDEWAPDENHLGGRQLLWSKELETYLEGERLMLPRMLLSHDQNDRINSSNRVLRKPVPIGSHKNLAVECQPSSSLYDVVEVPMLRPKSRLGAEKQLIRVSHSTLLALRVMQDTFLFVVSGIDCHSGDSVVGFSATNSLHTTPLAIIRLPCGKRDNAGTGNLLGNIASQILASSIIDSIVTGARILVNCANGDNAFLHVLFQRVKSSGSLIIPVASQVDLPDGQNMSPLHVSCQMSQQDLRRKLRLAQPSHFLDLSEFTQGRRTGTQTNLGLNIVSNLPPNCRILRPDALLQRKSRHVSLGNELELTARLENAFLRAYLTANASHPDCTTGPFIPLHEVRRVDLPLHATSLISWSAETPIEATVHPLDASGIFSANRTYILVGLSGELGQSLCEFMVAYGAGCVCLTSRRPNIDERWLASFQETKADVRVFSMDVTEKDGMEQVINEIRASCPPIAGVAHGAMVLSDVLFSHMTADQMTRVLEPKILGAIHLDEIFGEEDLDFFMLFSSIVSVSGNQGQSNYSAANGYLGTLARQRRNRGLAASVFDLGRVAGLGAFEMQGQELQSQIIRTGVPAVSESDVHDAFTEAILTGYSRPGDQIGVPDASLVTGIRCFTIGENVKGPWFTNPMFAHVIRDPAATDSEGAIEAGLHSSTKVIRVGQRLLEASNEEEAGAVLQESFAVKLKAVLQLSDRSLDPHTPLVELGIDSLVAVEIRSWFLKELKVDVPVLRIIGGTSLIELCSFALDKLPKTLAANAIDVEASTKIRTPVSELAPSATPESSKDNEGLSSSGPLTQNSDSSPRSPTPDFESARDCSDDDDDATVPFHKADNHNGADRTDSTHHRLVEEDTEGASIQGLLPKATRKIIKKMPISFAQSGHWFLHQLVGPQVANVAFQYHIEGKLRVSDFAKALRVVCVRHEALRTIFIPSEDDSVPAYQCVLARSPVRLQCEAVSSERQVAQRFQEMRGHAFDLESGELLQVVLLTLEPDSHFLLIQYHHILMDGISTQVLLSELESAYRNKSLGPTPQQYPDFSAMQRLEYAEGGMAEELEYWRGLFPDGILSPILPLLPMAQKSTRTALTEFDSHETYHALAPEVSEKIRLIAKFRHATPFHFYLAAFQVLLFRFTDADSLVIGMADAARNSGETLHSIGHFLNLLPLKFQSRLEQSFVDAVTEARAISHAALERSRLPFDLLLTGLGLGRSSAHSPLFQAFIDYRPENWRKQGWAGCQLDLKEWHVGKTAYDITMDIIDDKQGAVVILRAQKSLYDSRAAELLLEAYTHLLQQFASNPEVAVNEPSLFSQQSIDFGLQIGRGPFMTSSWPETLLHRIDQVAQDHPEHIALKDGHGSTLTYSGMAERIDGLSNALRAANVCPGDRVLVFQRAGIDWICCMLAIMRVGAIYVPMNIRNPRSRLASIANDCSPKAIMADSTTASDVPRLDAPQARHIDIGSVTSQAAWPSRKVVNSAHPDAPAAIIYTSGSVGKPKGILLSHKGLRNEIEGYTKTWGLGAERVLQHSAFTFDFAFDQIFTGLVNGGTVYVVTDEARGDALAISSIIKRHQITYTRATPSEYLLWLQHGRDDLVEANEWRFAFAGGETLTGAVIRELQTLKHDKLRFFNSYGPAETSISSCKMEVKYKEAEAESSGARIGCGYSLPNYHTFILNDKMQPQPVGMPGEVCISGAGVSLGYFNNDELTRRQFVQNPFASEQDVARGWTHMYRTNDIAHLNKDGALVFRGRMEGDTQVKIHGIRVDLTDIEANMMTAADGMLKAVVVTLREDKAQFLVAHVVFRQSWPLAKKESFLSHLLRRLPLPQYMVPVAALPIDELPLNNHSKLDRKAVMAMELPKQADKIDSSYDMELTETMIRLRRLWRNLIGDKILSLGSSLGPSTSFFHVGGNSLLIIALMARINAEFGVALSLAELLNTGSLLEMADAVDAAATATAIDWDKETAPPDVPSFLSAIGSSGDGRNLHIGKVIIVTGGTGFLGRHLLQTLVRSSGVAKIHCIAVRERAHGDTQGLFLSEKITYYLGDLTAPLLGLDQNTFYALASEADAVVHLGASRSMWDGYHVLRATNVDPTRELIKMASPRRVPIYFISTIAASATGDASLAEESPVPSATYSADGYVLTKWASERLLQRAWEDLGVPSTTFRFLPAKVQAAAPLSLLDEMVQLAGAARAVPDPATWKGLLYLTPVSKVSTMMRDAILSHADQESATVTHHQCDVALLGDDILAHIGPRSEKKDWETMPILKWIGMLKRSGFSYFLAAHDASVGEGLSTNR